MKNFRLLPLSLALSAAFALPVHAQSLIDLYEAARSYDAAYLSAKSLAQANQHKADQAKASLLPSVNLSATASSGQVTTETPTPGDRKFDTQSTSVSLSQPLYRPANLASYQQGKRQADIAEAQLLAAEQDLIVRTSQSYFDVLGAQDTLAFVQAQKAAVAEQLASAKRNFEVGTATITDTREAQARHDLVTAQEIAAENDLRVKKLALDKLTGKVNTAPKPLSSNTLPPLQPTDVTPWVEQAQSLHPGIKQSRIALEVAELETEKSIAGHKPTLDFTASHNLNSNVNGNTTLATSSRSNSQIVGVTLTLPLFAGFATQNRLRETLSLEDKARADLEAVTRDTIQGTRAAFFGVLSGLGQVKALEAAEASSQSALDANKLGYQVGVRINIDVLNAQSQLYQTKRDLAKARYDVLVGGLKLRQASGTLKTEDLTAINELLAK